MRMALNIAVWSATLLCLVVGGLLATTLTLMPASIGPSEMIEGGLEPWMNAIYAALAFVLLAIAAVIGLACWHSARFKVAGLVLTAVEVGAVAWAVAKIYVDYF